MAFSAVQRRALRLKQRRRRRGKAPPLRSVPRQRLPVTIGQAHEQEIDRLARRLGDLIERFIIPALPTARVDGGVRMDQGGLGEALRSTSRAFGKLASSSGVAQRAAKIGRRVDSFVLGEVERQVESVLGVTLDAASTLRPDVETFVRRNARGMAKLGRKEVAKIGEVLADGARRGLGKAELTNLVKDRVKVIRSKARSIARREVLRLNGKLTEARHKSIGITSYTWRTLGDDLVRPEHAAFEGTVRQYSGSGVIPGEDPNCRCSAEPKMEQAIAAVELAA